MDEAISALHAEMKVYVENRQRLAQPFTKSVDLDFKVDGLYPFTQLDIKHLVGSEILQKQGQKIDIKTIT